ncbi:MAG TPA: c-type cytochrome [Acidimicrobiia bacterium]|nr:c-type cytochrome [Acidimicrobiia bacterium]
MKATTARGLLLAGVLALGACGGGGSTEGMSGAELFVEIGCHACHGDSDTEVAPTLEGVWGSEVSLSDGRTVVVDEDYVTQSLTDPNADIVEGFEPRMPAFALTESEVDRLVDYVRSRG